MRRYQSESSTSILIDDLVVKAFKEAHERKIDRLMKDDVPQKELNYIYDVAVVMHNHNQPCKPEFFNPHFQIPDEKYSKKMIKCNKIVLKKMSKMQKTSSFKSRKKISTRMSISFPNFGGAINQNNSFFNKMNKSSLNEAKQKLIPLLQHSRQNVINSQQSQRQIQLLRKRKLRIEETNRAFREEKKKIQQQIQIKKKKGDNSSLINFTTDFNGNILNFSNRPLKSIQNNSNVVVRIHTLVQNGSWSKKNLRKATVLMHNAKNRHEK